MPSQYLVYPDEQYSPDNFYPYAVPEVDNNVTEVVSPAGSVWEKVSDEVDDYAMALACALGTMVEDSNETVPLNRLVPARTGTVVDYGVVKEMWAQTMHASHADFAALNTGLLSANAVTGEKVYGELVDAPMVTGATVRTSAGFPRTELTEYGLRAFNDSGDNTVNLQGADNVLTAPTFRTSATGDRSEFTEDGFRVIKDGATVFQAGASVPTGCQFWNPEARKLTALSSLLFGPQSVKDTHSYTVANGSMARICEFDFTPPSGRTLFMAMFDYKSGGNWETAGGYPRVDLDAGANTTGFGATVASLHPILIPAEQYWNKAHWFMSGVLDIPTRLIDNSFWARLTATFTGGAENDTYTITNATVITVPL